MKSKSSTEPTARVDPSDNLPLLPRDSAKDVWARTNKPLPPLPEKPVTARAKTAPATDSAEIADSATGELDMRAEIPAASDAEPLPEAASINPKAAPDMRAEAGTGFSPDRDADLESRGDAALNAAAESAINPNLVARADNAMGEGLAAAKSDAEGLGEDYEAMANELEDLSAAAGPTEPGEELIAAGTLPEVRAKSTATPQPASQTTIEEPGGDTGFVPWGKETNGPGIAPKSAPQPAASSLKQFSPENYSDIIQAHKGEVLLINCWGIDCEPCVAELPHLDKVAQQFRAKGLYMIGINTDVQRRWPEVETFVRENKLSFEVMLRAPGPDTKFRASIDTDYGADPFTVIFDRNGKKIVTVADALTLDEWTQLVSAVLENRAIPITKPDVIRLH